MTDNEIAIVDLEERLVKIEEFVSGVKEREQRGLSLVQGILVIAAGSGKGGRQNRLLRSEQHERRDTERADRWEHPSEAEADKEPAQTRRPSATSRQPPTHQA